MTSFRLPAVVTLVGVAAAYFLLGGPLAVRGDLVAGVIPSGQTFRDLAHTLVHGWKRLLTMLPPVDAIGPLLALPLIVGLVGAAVTYTVARRWTSPYAVLPAPLALLALGIALGTLEPAGLLVQGVLFGLLAIGWMVLRAARDRAPLQNGAGRGARAGLAAGLLAVAAVAGYAAGPHLPGADADARVVARSAVTPPFDVAQYPSPLAGYRRYTEPNPADLWDRDLLRVEGLPAGTPLRFATLDAYDGAVWGASNRANNGTRVAGAAFQQVGSRVATRGEGRPVQVRVTVPEDGYRDVWLPTAGTVTGICLRRQPGRPAGLSAVAQRRHQHRDRSRPPRGWRQLHDGGAPARRARRAARSRCPSTTGRSLPTSSSGSSTPRSMPGRARPPTPGPS